MADAWRATVRVPRRRVALALIGVALVAGCLLARLGTPRARVGAGVTLVAVSALLVVLRRIEARSWEDPERTVRRLVAPIDPEKAGRALRALTLVKPVAE